MKVNKVIQESKILLNFKNSKIVAVLELKITKANVYIPGIIICNTGKSVSKQREIAAKFLDTGKFWLRYREDYFHARAPKQTKVSIVQRHVPVKIIETPITVKCFKYKIQLHSKIMIREIYGCSEISISITKETIAKHPMIHVLTE